MKILLVGEYAWPWYQEACARALENSGCQVIRFGWLDRFKKWLPYKAEPVYRSFWHRLQYRLLDGPTIRSINRDLIKLAVYEKPDVVWCYNAQIIYSATIHYLRKCFPNTIYCQYANDNPFSLLARQSMWRHFIASIPLFDLHYVFRKNNISDFMAHGANDVHLLRAYFIREFDYPINPKDIKPNFICDVAFAGHYENDGRVEALESICKAGYKLNLYGGGWNAALPKLSLNSPLRALYPIQPVTGFDYNQALCGAKVALCFLSTLNQDTYTRRSFQIPAMQVAMLSQRTEDLSSLFIEGKEIAFFSDTTELIDKLQHLLTDDTARQSIAKAGYARVYRDGHEVSSRMKQWLDTVQEYQKRL
ncbi:MAG: glycosyltransferase [Candidatus Contendobacter sp.]|nr:glycosyltransferase [Candidatus Contendobacter sp.]